jgi:uncharacterized protein (DUF433 family)
MNTASVVQVAHPHIERKAGVHGGRPVLKDTRFPVSSIVQNHRRGLTVDEILIEFPHLSCAAVYDALSFYYDHREEIDREIAELSNLKQVAQEFPPTLQPSHASN